MTRKQVWEYPTIIEATSRLLNREMEEKERHLIIGAGVVLGSKRAYEEQTGKDRMGYWANAIRDQAEEAGMIAEEISNLAINGHIPEGALEKITGMGEQNSTKHNWRRPYWIIRERQPYEEEKLKELGKYIERRFCGREKEEGILRQLKGEEDWKFQRRKCLRQLKENERLTRALIEYFGGKEGAR